MSILYYYAEMRVRTIPDRVNRTAECFLIKEVGALVVGLLALVVAVPQARSEDDRIEVTDPTTDQIVGSTVDVKWNTEKIPKGLKTSDRVSVRIRCGKRQFPAKAVRTEPFTDGHKEVSLSDDPALVGVSCQASVFDENNADVEGFSKKFNLIKS
ncbi:6238_t:CDS:2 [Ambispora gerdemannii]|uniref:6238_t:CDS:1 n=1 Tax=Ambispora gerdemannii TaxID=144530 RepID=A0A9N8VB99_9GLOM|nr:6238_t:CDS:2 [Ambispora gerdemannii]